MTHATAPTTDRTWTELTTARRASMAAQGFPEGARVRVSKDAHPNIPEHCRFHRGDEGTVVLNMAVTDAEADTVCVVFDTTPTHTSAFPHSIPSNFLRVVPYAEPPLASGRRADGTPITARARRDVFDVFVGGWRVATLRTEKGARNRVTREAARTR